MMALDVLMDSNYLPLKTAIHLPKALMMVGNYMPLIDNSTPLQLNGSQPMKSLCLSHLPQDDGKHMPLIDHTTPISSPSPGQQSVASHEDAMPVSSS